MTRALLPAILLCLVASTACVRNPVTGKRQLALVSQEQEVELGQQARQEIGQQLAMVEDPRLQAYVSQVGERLAKDSERPDLPWSFEIVDDAAVNAFALPGGPIYITRGLLTHLNSEAELAIVLGHEIGHTTARHQVSQLSKAQLTQLGLGVGSILLPEDLQGLGQLAGVGTQLLLLRFGRDAERQSDQLGYKYALEDGYDVRAMPNVFETLGGVGGDQGRLPQWLSTHPDPENRVQAAQELVAKTPNLETRRLKLGRDEYLAHLEGVVFGENPRNGYFEGDRFLHPDLRFQLQFPSGWQAVNQAAAVVGISPNKDAAAQLSIAGTRSPEEAARIFFSTEGIQRGEVVAGQSNNLPLVAGYFRAQVEGGVLAGIAAFVGYEGRTYQLLTYTSAERLGAYDAAFKSTIDSFGPLTDPQALNVKPMRVAIVTAPRELTAAEAYQAFPSPIPLEQFALINGLSEGERIPAGARFKRIVGTPPPQSRR